MKITKYSDAESIVDIELAKMLEEIDKQLDRKKFKANFGDEPLVVKGGAYRRKRRKLSKNQIRRIVQNSIQRADPVVKQICLDVFLRRHIVGPLE